MNKRKLSTLTKIMCLILGMTAFGLITACTDKLVTEENNPRLAWVDFFSCVSEGDFAAAFEMTGSRLKVSSSDLDSELERRFLDSLSETCSYRFVSETDAKGVRAWQQVDITTLDMRKIAEKSTFAMLEQMEDQVWQHGSYKTDEALAAGVREALLEQLSEDCTDCLTTQRVKVEFHYQDDQWRPVMNTALYEAISGYAAYADQSVEAALKAYQEKRQAAEKTAETEDDSSENN